MVDWDDPDPQNDGDWRQATAYGANILTIPPSYDTACVIPLEIDASRPTEAQQWDGTAYHTQTRWQATGGALPCEGTLAVDFNAQIQSGIDSGLVVGAVVYCQAWYRDPGGPVTSLFTDALQFTIRP